MKAILHQAYKIKKSKGGRPNKLSIEKTVDYGPSVLVSAIAIVKYHKFNQVMHNGRWNIPSPSYRLWIWREMH
ncbi:hypothetical protein AB835_13120 [Candidatus Endobugula sertula]|uniref:Uncharacterized protein n=1 Tax=Candidatus Endobugula sertula TaxID=62101 RepID=A0A1D2QM21_9GAMM|nr:hypothetical protein AB835_13120 [Candidatus Endobugula sertula]